MQKRFIVAVLILLVSILPLAGCVQTPSADDTAGTAEAKKAAAERAATDPAAAAAAQVQAPAPTEAPRYSGPIQFSDVTAQAGIHFKHNSGAYGKHYLPETVGAGCAFLDYDNDGWQDILLVNSTNWPDHKGAKSFPALYHNNRNGTFTDNAITAGLAFRAEGQGGAGRGSDEAGDPAAAR